MPASPETPVESPVCNEESPATIDSHVSMEQSENPIPTPQVDDSIDLERPTARPSLKSARDRSPTPERYGLTEY